MASSKKDPYITKSYFDKKLDKALRGVVREIAEIVAGHIQHVDQRFDGVEKRLGRVEKDVGILKKDVSTLKEDVGTLKVDMGDVKRQLTDLKMDTPTQKEFDTLKARVDRYHPLS